MIRKVFATDDSIATAIMRIVLGVVFFAHGAQKMLGWFGGFGFSGTMGFFTNTMHIPAPLAFLATFTLTVGTSGAVKPAGRSIAYWVNTSLYILVTR